ncbi:hypothetical protein MASR2M15_04530 [Anaerolineales bacterium]
MLAENSIQNRIPYPVGLFKWLLRSPVIAQRLGFGFLLEWLHLMVITTHGRSSHKSRHTALEFRRHGSKIYAFSGYQQRPDWYQNLLVNPIVTLQIGNEVVIAKATPVHNNTEIVRVLHLFTRHTLINSQLLKRISSAKKIDFSTLLEVAPEFTVVRFDPIADEFMNEQPFPVRVHWWVPFALVILWVLMLSFGLILIIQSKLNQGRKPSRK